MFNFDGQMVAGVISDQFAARTFTEILERRRDASREAGPTEQDYRNLFNAYNQLVARFNHLIDENKKIDALYDRTLAARDTEIAEKDRLIAALESDFRDVQRYWTEAGNAAHSSDVLLIEANRRLRKAGLEEVL
jgi:hypothetical protein